mgnify:CR=1 FL=1
MRSPNASTSPFSQLIAYGVLTLLFTLLLCTCGPAPQAPTTTIVGNVRYDKGTQILNVDVAIDPIQTGFPSLYGSALPAFPAAGPGHFRGRRTVPFTSPVRLSVPCATGTCSLELAFTPPFADSIPPVINTKQSVRFAAGTTGLSATEILVTFFEPADFSTPLLTLLSCPTSSCVPRLPQYALSDHPSRPSSLSLVHHHPHTHT